MDHLDSYILSIAISVSSNSWHMNIYNMTSDITAGFQGDRIPLYQGNATP